MEFVTHPAGRVLGKGRLTRVEKTFIAVRANLQRQNELLRASLSDITSKFGFVCGEKTGWV